MVTAVFHYLNGGIRAQRVSPRVRPPVKAHLSVLLALIALVKAAGYVLQRYQLDTSNNGYVEGAGYTDVHARLPALELLFFISLFAARHPPLQHPPPGLDAAGAGHRGVGVRGPGDRRDLPGGAPGPQGRPGPEHPRAAVHPAQHQRHPGRLRPRQHVQVTDFAGEHPIPPGAVPANCQRSTTSASGTPTQSISLPTFQKLQDIKSYYTFQSPSASTATRSTEA